MQIVHAIQIVLHHLDAIDVDAVLQGDRIGFRRRGLVGRVRLLGGQCRWNYGKHNHRGGAGQGTNQETVKETDSRLRQMRRHEPSKGWHDFDLLAICLLHGASYTSHVRRAV